MIAKFNDKLKNAQPNLNIDTTGTEVEFVPLIPAPVLEDTEETEVVEVTSSTQSPISLENIPEELRGLTHWVGFKIENGRKVPIDPKPSSAILELPAKINDPATWGSFEEVSTLVNKGLAVAPGFAITKETGLIFVDFDCHMDSTSDLDEKKKIENYYTSFAQQVRLCGSYLETSISGQGLHLLAKGKLLDEYRKNKAPNKVPLEIYDDMRFMVMTGNVIDNNRNISDSEKVIGFIHNLQKRYFLPASDGATSGTDFSGKANIPISEKQVYSDEFILQTALKDEKFNLLWFDRWNEVKDKDGNPCYTHQHYADFALISKLIYYSHNCPSQAEKLFKLSPCYQAYGKNGKYPKNESDIRNDLKKASETCVAVYEVKPQVVVPPDIDIDIVDENGNWKPDFQAIQLALNTGVIKKPKLRTILQKYIDNHFGEKITYIPDLHNVPHNVNGYTDVILRYFGDKVIFSQKMKHYFLWNKIQFKEIDKKALYSPLTDVLSLLEHSVFMWTVKEVMFAELDDPTGEIRDNLEKEAISLFEWAVKAVNTRNCSDILIKLVGMTYDFDLLDYVESPYVTLQNGVLDLETKELLPHDPKYRQYKVLGCSYIPSATCPTFDTMLETLFPDSDTRRELLKTLGLCLSKNQNPAKKNLMLWVGPKDTGKTTLALCINKVLGDYAVAVDNSLLMESRNSSNVGPEMLAWRDTLCIQTSELSNNARLNSSKVKSITGNSIQSTRNIFEGFMSQFAFPGVMFIDSNYKPSIPNDDAMWDRIKLFPFTQVIKNKDVNIMKKLETESAGIFNRLLEYLAIVEEEKEIKETPAMLEAKDEYQEEMTPIAQFFGDCLERTDNNDDKIETRLLHDTYQKWCKDVGTYPLGRSKFYMELLTQGVQRMKSSKNYFKCVKFSELGRLYAGNLQVGTKAFEIAKKDILNSNVDEPGYKALRGQLYEKSKGWFKENINYKDRDDMHLYQRYPVYAGWCIKKGIVPLTPDDFNAKCYYLCKNLGMAENFV